MTLYGNYYYEEHTKEVELKTIYELLTNEYINTNGQELDKKVVERIITWLPNIKRIEVYRYATDDNYVNIYFASGEMIQFDNVGIEYAMYCISEQ